MTGASTGTLALRRARAHPAPVVAVLVNVLIGVVLTSLDEARDMEREETRDMERLEPPGPAALPAAPEERHLLLARIATARRALDDLERDLARGLNSSGARLP